MRIVDFIRDDLIIPQLRARDPDGAIGELGDLLAGHLAEVSEEDIVRVLAERERQGSTAIGGGVAIPHAKLPGIRSAVACVGRSSRGIDFGSPDGKPTHLFFGLIAPEGAHGEHLKALARISHSLRNGDFRTRLMAARSAREIYELLAAEPAQ